MRSLLTFALLFSACSPNAAPGGGGDDDTAPPDGAEPPGGCLAGKAGAACILELFDRATSACDPATVAELRAELDARAGMGPLWANGRALFRTAQPISIAGAFNDWTANALVSSAVCGTDLVVAAGAVPSGHWQYKLTDGSAWSLDPQNPAFAYDDFAGNPDGANSVLATPDAGRGQLVRLERACSTALGNCRGVTAYLPPGYDAREHAARTYPVLFMHDGQNVWDDHDCCFGHTGWEVNVTLDAEIAAGRVAPIIVIAADNTPARNAEYGLSASAMAAFMKFQVEELQPAALAQVRWDGARVGVAGSSLGGLVAMHLALRHPQTYGAVASLSGAFWPEETALRPLLPGLGKQALAVYLDHGGRAANNSDGAADSIAVRDALAALGWQTQVSPACTTGPDALCYFTEPGATHDELAWKARAFRFLRFLYPAP
ncbi:MAG: hypothetical protein KF773_13450 [Deltaproteobacteria bacterium]|nr:hypothetical protein [Deltaproteobacteria bacterium]